MDTQETVPQVPANYPVQVRPSFTAVPVTVQEEDEKEELALVKWLKTNIFAVVGLIASLLTLYASSQVRPLTQELTYLKEQLLEVKTTQAQVLGIMDTKYANKEMTDLQYQTLNMSVDKLNKSMDMLIELHTSNKTK